jgi:hypothetical protein
MSDDSSSTPPPRKRRPHYSGKHPRRFQEKYKEHDPRRYAETVAKVMASGKTPAGTHRPIMVAEILEVLSPKPGEFAVDCTLGYGGHAQEILPRLQPGGKLLGPDTDPIERPRRKPAFGRWVSVRRPSRASLELRRLRKSAVGASRAITVGHHPGRPRCFVHAD